MNASFTLSFGEEVLARRLKSTSKVLKALGRLGVFLLGNGILGRGDLPGEALSAIVAVLQEFVEFLTARFKLLGGAVVLLDVGKQEGGGGRFGTCLVWALFASPVVREG